MTDDDQEPRQFSIWNAGKTRRTIDYVNLSVFQFFAVLLFGMVIR